MFYPNIPAELFAPVWNPKSYVNRDAMEQVLATLRRDYPLSQVEVPGYEPHWVVTKYKDVREVSRLDDVFHSGDVSKSPVSKFAEQMMRQYSGGNPWVFRTLVHMDEPDHTAYRNVLKDLFMPQSISSLEGMVREIVRRYVDKMAASGPTMDFANDFAAPYPLEVICTLLGLPKEDHEDMLRLTQWFLSYADPDLCRPGSQLDNPEHQVKTWQIVYDKIKSYYDPIIEARRAQPTNDVASLIANGKVNGRLMDERELVSYYTIASTAGHDTTAASMGTTLWTLAKRPDLLAQLKADPKLIPAFIEEAFRWATPAMCFIRSATQDYELSGRQIKKGDRLYVSYLSANKDEDVFDDPFEFRLDRTPNRHIAFSYGGHICLGQHLARLEMRVLFEELIPRLESLEMAGEGKWQESEFVCGPKSIPIRYTMK